MDTPIALAGGSPRPLTAGQRAGIWVGFHGWLIGFVVATVPETGKFAGPLLGGWALTVVLILGFEAVARHTRDPGTSIATVAACVGIILVYYSLAVEPAILAHPPAMDRLEDLGSVTHCPWWVGASVAGVGLGALVLRSMRGMRGG